ncbi:MAG: PEGA domain-containing protein [Blastocatellia bacterium]
MKRSFCVKAMFMLALFSGLQLPPLAAYAQEASKVKLEEGTQVRLKLMEPLTSATAQVGQVVSFEVLDEVRVGEALAIAEGATAWGTIIEAEGKKFMGRAGKLALQIDYVKAVDGTKIPLRASNPTTQGKGKGVTTGIAVGASAVLFWPAAPFFLLMKGKQAQIPKGFHVAAFVDGDRLITPRLADATTAPGSAPATMITSASSTSAFVQAALRPPGGEARPIATDFGAVNIISDPGGAEVEIDGAYYGNTPGLIRLTAGLHTITIRATGHEAWKRTLNLGPGSSLTVKADLVRSGGQTARNK